MALDMKFDQRLIERNIEKGLTTRDEYNKHIEDLPDLADSLDVIDIEQPIHVVPEESDD